MILGELILAVKWYHGIVATLFAMLAVILMLVILLQRGKGVGLAGAFGGSATNTAFGSKTGDVLTWATVVIASVFLLFAVVLNYLFVPLGGGLTAPPPATVAPLGGATETSAAAPVPVSGDDELSQALGGGVSTEVTIPPATETPVSETPVETEGGGAPEEPAPTESEETPGSPDQP